MDGFHRVNEIESVGVAALADFFVWFGWMEVYLNA